ncbi:transglycosylase domain-containing protein [Fretibacter rubidus]|uniref:transglycosylase domain-containing protein n=1 Tax=Fretibacter rubidus TaxID=570162 RepID=UPI00352AA549
MPLVSPVLRKKRRFKAVKVLCAAGVLSGYLGGMAALSIVAMASQDMPSGETFYTPNRPVSVQIVDRYGRDLAVRGAAEMRPAKLDRLPDHLSKAVMAVEDRRFYSHTGVDPIGLMRAAYMNLKAGRVVQGGSTLSQQLIKNVFLTPEQTLNRKLQEMMLAIWLEYKFTKTEVLETYLSRVYFGGGAWGLEAASETYFDKEASELTLSESALLAGVLKAPSRYNPAQNPSDAAARTGVVIRAMADAGYIDRQMQLRALSDPIAISRPSTDGSENYFVDWMWEEMIAAIGTPTRDIIVHTTLDKAAQMAASDAVTRHLDPRKNAAEVAVVSLDGTGGVQIMVGGARYSQSQFNRAAQAERQPGSAFKPFVYLTAFNAGLTPWDVRVDAPIVIGDWEPQNFTKKYKGDVTLDYAFRQSLNTVAVSLSEEVGRERVVDTAERLRAGSFKPLRSLALGAQVTTPLALTHSYLPFANAGDTADVHGILSISTADGTPLYERPKSAPRKVINATALGHINHVMVNTVTSGTGQGAQIKGRDIGGKTGTTNDFRDAWFVGYVPDRVTGVWVGADDFSPMVGVTGGTIPAQIWHDTMSVALADIKPRYIPVSQKPITQFNPIQRRETSLDLLLADIENVLPQQSQN